MQSLVGAERFRLLGRERSLDGNDWDPQTEEKLWRYNLHYFDDLNAQTAEARVAWHKTLLDRWIAANPPAQGTGWEPYPTSLRIVNWIKWLQRVERQEQAWLDSLATQARWLSRRIEWHLLGNHLFVNAKALFMAGLYFNGPEADRWRNLGASILRRELDEQVLGDGGQFERTPMYHLLALEDVLDMLACLRRFGAPDRVAVALEEQLREAATRMWSWADIMRFSDGCLPRLNDSADGVAPEYGELVRVAQALNLQPPLPRTDSIHLLKDTGYARLQWDRARAFLDVAPVGPDYLPGHAHADTLSFELEVSGRLLVVNRGTSCYGLSGRRSFERSTAAHSTVEIAGRSSSETWSGFRVGRRARPRDLRIAPTVVSCSHDGYRFLASRPIHQRLWSMSEAGLRVDDVVNGPHQAVARYHLAPGLRADEGPRGTWRICSTRGEEASVDIEAAWIRPVEGLHALGFGTLVPAQTLEVGLDRGRASTLWTWKQP